MNRGQQAHYIQRNSWGKNIEALEVETLGIGFRRETENYRYSIKIDTSIVTLKAKPNEGIAIDMGIAKKPNARSYVGIVFLDLLPNYNEVTSISILCESELPTMQVPKSPKWDGKTLQCPEDYVKKF